MQKTKKIRDCYFNEDKQNYNNFTEILTGDFSSLDNYIFNSPQVQQILGSNLGANVEEKDKEKIHKKQKRLLKKILQAATKTLTDRQLQIFMLRFIFDLTEEDISKRVGRSSVGRPKLNGKVKEIKNKINKNKKSNIHPTVSQPYVAEIIKTSIRKIKKELRLENNQ